MVVALILLACGGEESPAPASGPSPAVVAAQPGPFSLKARCGEPDRAPPVIFTGDATDVVVTVHPVDTFAADPGEPVHSGPAKRNEWYFLPPLRSGLYVVVARRSEEIASCRLVVSDLAVVVKRSRREVLVYVADAESGRPVPSATVKLRAGEKTVESDTDSLGVCRVDMPATPNLEVLVTKQDRIGYAEVAALPGGDVVTWFGFDRPVYAPGDTVNVAGVYRARNGDYRAADLPDFRIEIRDERDSVVASADPTEQSPGFFHGAVRIPPDPPPGPLWLVAGDAGRRRLRLARPFGLGVGVLLDAPETAEPGKEVSFSIDAVEPPGRSVVHDAHYHVEAGNRGLVRILLSGRSWFGGTKSDTVRFTPEAPGRLTLRIRVPCGDGYEVNRTATILCGRPEAADRGETPRGLRLLATPAEVEPGGQVRVTLDFPPNLADATVLTTVEGGPLGPHAVERTESTRIEYDVSVPDRPGRVLRIGAVAVRDRRAHRAEALVSIRSGPRRLPVAVSFEPEMPAPGAPAKLVIAAPADGRAVVTVFEDTGRPIDARIEEEFYGRREDVAAGSDSLAFKSRSAGAPGAEDGTGPEPACGEVSPRPVLWRADVRLVDGRAVVPVTLPVSPHRLRVVATVATNDHRFGTATRVLRLPEPPPEAPTEPRPPWEVDDTPTGIERRIGRARALTPGVSRETFELPADAGFPALSIVVTRGPLGAALRSLPTEATATTGTSDEALMAFVPAAVARAVDPDAADRAGFTAEVVTRLTLRATARLYARQAKAGGFAPWDGAAPDPFVTARVIRGLVRAREAGMPADGDRIERAADWLAALDAKARGEPPELTPSEKTAIALSGRLSEPGVTVDEGVRAAVRSLLDARRGPAWCGPRTTTAAALALLDVRRLAGPDEGEPVPLRIRVGSELAAAVTLSPAELAAGGRKIEIGGDSLAPGPITVSFEAGRDVDADIAARLTWLGGAPKGQVEVARTVHSLIPTEDGVLCRPPVEAGNKSGFGEAMGLQLFLVSKRVRGPVEVICRIARTATPVSPAVGLEAGLHMPAEPPGTVLTNDRVRLLLRKLPEGTLLVGYVIRVWTPGGYVPLPRVAVRDLETGELLGISNPDSVTDVK